MQQDNNFVVLTEEERQDLQDKLFYKKKAKEILDNPVFKLIIDHFERLLADFNKTCLTTSPKKEDAVRDLIVAQEGYKAITDIQAIIINVIQAGEYAEDMFLKHENTAHKYKGKEKAFIKK